MMTALFSVAYAASLIQRRRSCATRTADDLSVNHGGVAIVAGADIALSPIDTAYQPTKFEIVCARARVGCFAVVVVLARLAAAAAAADVY